MAKSFDDLFNEFFENNDNSFEDHFFKMNEEAMKLIEILGNIHEPNDSIDENLEHIMDQTLGEPDEVINYQDGKLFFQKFIWHTPSGDFVKVIVTDKPLLNDKLADKPLQQQLDEAISSENYEEAAKIRDLMTPIKKKGRKKKVK